MKKEQFITGDIVVDRSGYTGVVIKNDGDEYILFQTIGSDSLDEYNSDLTYNDQDCREADIMEVHRGVTFYDIDHGDGFPVWQRDLEWERPSEAERKAMEEQKELARQKWLEEMRIQSEKSKKESISILAQAFYGNRTATEIYPDSIDRFILGYMNDTLPIDRPIDRTVIELPETDGVVIIYNKYREEERLADGEKWFKEDGYIMKPLAEIPEKNIRIFSRCIACRMDASGKFISLEEADYSVLMNYFAG